MRNNLIKCPTCKTEYENQPEKCHHCSYPFSGTDKERAQFVAHLIMKKGEISETKDHIKETRTILFIIAGANIVLPFFQYTDEEFGVLYIILSILIGLTFLFFAFSIKKNPLPSILIPLILLLLFYTIETIIDPTFLVRGIIWKFLFIGSMIYSLVGIIQSEKIKMESEYLATKKYD